MKKIFALALALLFCLLSFAACGEEVQSDLRVLFFSVGKADAILIETKSETILVDTGYEEDYTTIKSALTREGITTIDHMILTHYDKDHIGSAQELLSSCTVGTLYLPDYQGMGGEYADLAVFLTQYNGATETVTDLVTLSLDGFTMTIDPTRLTSLTSEDDNDHSLIISLKNDNFSMLLMGDAEKSRVVEYASRDSSHYDVVKLPHHGDYFKDLAWYIGEITPLYAIHCCESGDVAEKLDAACTERGITQFTTGNGNVTLTYTLADNKLIITQ